MRTKVWSGLVLVLLVASALGFAAGQGDAAAAAKPSGPVTLTMFYPIDPKTASTVKSYNELLYFKEMEKRTGIKLDFKHPPAGQENEQFNLLMASNTLPDMVYWDWNSVPGGPGRAVAEGQILRLNELVDKYAPSFKKTFTEHPDWRKQIVLDDGSYYIFPKIKKDDYLLISNGPQIRADWLERIGVKPPTTMKEWYSVLTAVKKAAGTNGIAKNVIPFTGYGTSLKISYANLRKFAYAWATPVDFYQDGSKVKFGPAQPAFKDYLAEMRRWYAEGLLDPDYVSNDQKAFEAKFMGDRVAAYCGLVSGHMGKFYGLKKDDPSFKLIGLPLPVGPAGKSYGPKNPNATGQGIAVAARASNQQAAMKWGDYLYTEDGTILANYGVEGVTYKMVNGVPQYTDEIMNNPDGLPVINALSKYLTVSSNGVLIQLEGSFRAAHNPIQQKTTETFIASSDSSLDMPPAQPSPKDAEALGARMADIWTYTDEMFNKFIMGTTPLTEFDSYVAQLRKMGIGECETIWQKVVDNYKKR